MAPYDSDSSEGEDNDFTETNVLLGYASADANGEEISRLGGRPDWIDPKNPPSSALARCNVCKDMLVLLLQLNAELPDRFPGHERRLYIFSCRRKSCRRKEGSTRVIRGVRISPDAPPAGSKENKPAKEAPPAPKASSQGIGEALFGVKPAAASIPRANPFATSSSPAAAVNPFAPKTAQPAANPFSAPQQQQQPAPEPASPEPDAAKDLPKTFAETLSLNNPQPHGPPPPAEPWPEESAQPEPYPVRWLSDAEYETLEPVTMPNLPAQKMEIDTSDAGGSAGGKEDKEVFESSMDATFQKFADRVGENPDQCIRYEFAGQPLLYSKTDKVGALLHVAGEGNVKVTTSGSKGFPRCGNCGAGRVFEVQLAPHAIEELEIDEDGLDGMDWGTVIIGVCEKDCQQRGVVAGEAGYVEEWAGVQWEELTAKR
ncbi:programmed cell death protein 2 [Cercophora newfieldiana]|uniref:Programmed cell death protein 2 n=1 Tax=Cercophora newfieldiana TaxID=92897 RepID=A0AA39YCU6_9PEZI|nr:programmed cell death protein 2 [Cercophora newfieldiana]